MLAIWRTRLVQLGFLYRTQPAASWLVRPRLMLTLFSPPEPRSRALFVVLPFPVPDFGHVLAVGVDVALVLDQLVLHGLFEVAPLGA
jgi:hypothetical protein